MRILVVDDNQNDIELIKNFMRYYSAKNSDFPTEVVGIYGNRDELVEVLDQSWDVIVMDYTIPGGLSWPDVFPIIRDKSDAPIIVISGVINGSRGLSAITVGAADYIPKDDFDHLGHAIHRAYLYDKTVKSNQIAANSLIKRADSSHSS